MLYAFLRKHLLRLVFLLYTYTHPVPSREGRGVRETVSPRGKEAVPEESTRAWPMGKEPEPALRWE